MRLLTSKEFAKLIGVSQPTISRAMNDSDQVSAEKKEYIRQKAAEYGFVLNSQARSLKTNRTGTVGILFPKHFISMNANLMLAHLYDCVQLELSRFGYDIVVIYDYGISEDGVTAFERIIKKRKVDGFIILRLDLSAQELKLIRDSKIPCIHLLNSSSVETNISSCVSDSEYGGYLAGRYLGRFSDYDMYFLNITEEAEDSRKRLQGFQKGLADVGSTLPAENILQCVISFQSAYTTISNQIERFKGKKSAIFAYNDMVAIGAAQAFRCHNLKIPDDVQLVGMDDIPLASQLAPKLSTLHVPVKEMASLGCSWLRNAIEKREIEPVKKIVKPQLYLRDTTI